MGILNPTSNTRLTVVLQVCLMVDNYTNICWDWRCSELARTVVASYVRAVVHGKLYKIMRLLGLRIRYHSEATHHEGFCHDQLGTTEYLRATKTILERISKLPAVANTYTISWRQFLVCRQQRCSYATNGSTQPRTCRSLHLMQIPCLSERRVNWWSSCWIVAQYPVFIKYKLSGHRRSRGESTWKFWPSWVDWSKKSRSSEDWNGRFPSWKGKGEKKPSGPIESLWWISETSPSTWQGTSRHSLCAHWSTVTYRAVFYRRRFLKSWV